VVEFGLWLACLRGPVVPFSRRRQVAVGGGRQTAPVAPERERATVEGRGGVVSGGVSGFPQTRTQGPSPFCLISFSFFLAQLNIIQINSGPVLVNG